MMKVTTKTVFSLALMTVVLSTTACSMEYNKQRDPNMKLSTPPMVQTPTPTIAGSMKGEDMVVSPSVTTTQTTVVTPVERPIFMGRTAVPISNSSDVQMLGQPGTGPAILSPTSETMPDLQPMVYDGSYPRSSR